MKKITFVLSLLLSVCAMTTSAQTLDRSTWSITTSSECKDGNTGHAAAIIDGDNQTYWHSIWAGSSEQIGDATATLPQFFVVDLGKEETFRSILYTPRQDGVNANGTVTSFKVYVSNDAFQGVDANHSSKDVVNSLGAASFEGTFDYTGLGRQPRMVASSATDLTGRYVMFVVTGAESGDQKNKFASCAEFNLSKDNYTRTFHYLFDGKEIGTITKDVEDPINNAPLFSNIYINGNVTKKDGTDNDYDVVVTIPFEYTSTFDASTAKWYAIDIHNNQGNLLWKSDDNTSISVESVAKGTVTGLTDNYRWAFVGDFTNGFRLYNKATNKAAILNSANLSFTDGEGDLFKVKPSTASNKAKGFCLYKTEGSYLNHQGTSIKTWTATDEGSTMHVQDANSYAIAFATPFTNYDDSNAPKGAIGANAYLTVADNLNTFKAAYAAATADDATVEKVNALKNINEQIASATTTTVEAGNYYRLYNVKDKKWLCIKASENDKMTTEATSGKLISSVITFDNAEPGRFRMKIEGKTLGKYIADNKAITLEGDDSNSKGSYVVAHVGTNFTFYDMASNQPHSYLHCNNANGNANLVGWTADGSPCSHWYVVPATDVEVDLNTVGTDAYASAYLPFSVSAVEGAEAYVGTLNDDNSALDMTKVEGVPANNGFVLVGTGDKATLTIGTAVAVTNNSLTGTNTGITLADDTRANYLVFGKNADVVGFYTPSASVTKIGANKAYLDATALTGAGAIAMNFGGTTTAINTANVNNQGVNAPVFDLSGRRVVAPVKGGVYIQNGKKFIK